MPWQLNSREAVYLQIANRLRERILAGEYPPDSQIPSVRQLATEAAVNPNTMQKALLYLEEEGILAAQGTLGRFVTSDIEILEKAKTALKEQAMRDWLAQAKSLGITKEELIAFITKEAERK